MKDFLALLRGRILFILCRLRGMNITIGQGLRIYKRVSISGPGRIEIGKNCVMAGIRGDSSQYVCLETLNSSSVIQIGDNASLYAARIAAKFRIVVGNDVLIEEAGMMDTDYHTIAKNRETPASENEDKCRVTVGNRVCMGARSSILKGTTIGDDVIIAPGSIVTMSVKPGSTVAGNPARILST
jgi:acetyltransferase-like isoleucine patch superfamily enzyme